MLLYPLFLSICTYSYATHLHFLQKETRLDSLLSFELGTNTEFVVELKDQFAVWSADLVYEKCCPKPTTVSLSFANALRICPPDNKMEQSGARHSNEKILLPFAGLKYTHDRAEMQSPPVPWTNISLLHNRDQQNFVWWVYVQSWDKAVKFSDAFITGYGAYSNQKVRDFLEDTLNSIYIPVLWL